MANKKDDKQLTLGLEEPIAKTPPKPRKKPSAPEGVSGGNAKAVTTPKKPKEPVSVKKPTKKATTATAKPQKEVSKTPKTSKKVPSKPTKIVRTLARNDIALEQVTPPKTVKKTPRVNIQPPELGTRKGYCPPVLVRLQPIAFVLAALVCLAILISFFAHRNSTAKNLGPGQLPVLEQKGGPIPIAIQIVSGMTAREVCFHLELHKVTSDGQGLLDYLIKENLASVLRSGSYLMQAGMDDVSIANLLTAKGLSVSLSIPPGFTAAAIDSYLANRGYAPAGSFLQSALDLQIAYGLSFYEGWLLCGTYSVEQDTVADNLALGMYGAMTQALQPFLDSEMIERYGVESVLIIASMIQAETQNATDMPLIASVIYNRLEAGQPLGIDATTRYELNDWDHPIPSSALEKQTAYNTRRKTGLVPTGICSPSMQALQAACFPKNTDYFYYLHGKDKVIHLAKTYEGHKKNIEAYR
jgi:UPF0755 protein